MDNITRSRIDELIDLALIEDLGDGDHTSLSCVPADKKGAARLLVKEHGIIAGIEIADIIFKKIDQRFNTEYFIMDGAKVSPGDVAFKISGPSQSILKAERLMLNVMQRMSGIATKTRTYVDLLEGLNTKILDTRKTTPGFRIFEKMAVKIGGGANHRFGLFDMILIKDNHVDFAGGISNAIQMTRDYLKNTGRNLRVEIEVRNLTELGKVLHIGLVDRIMLDNFTIEQTKEAVNQINKKFETESSGGININTIRAYAECGVDYISVGDLTHHINSLDLSLKAVN